MERKFGTTAYQAKYFAYDLTREGGRGLDRLQQSLLNASVDLNPHQVEAALFALRSPISKGVLLADEVGLGKTIEAGLVMCQLWAERKRKILVVCPASLRKQWQCELEDKFNLPSMIVDAKAVNLLQKDGFANPYDKPTILISSYPFAARESENLRKVQWNLVVMDEAHKLRNSYRESHRVGKALRWALADRRKLLLTATPLQNSLVELYGIATLLDSTYFGDLASFRARYVNAGGNLDELKVRIREFAWRTLRKDVKAFVKYTNRLPLTESFSCSDAECELYEDVSKYLQDKTTYAFPVEQRQLLTLIVRKVLASSPAALIGTLKSILIRLKKLQTQPTVPNKELFDDIANEDPDLFEKFEEDEDNEQNPIEKESPSRSIDPHFLSGEIDLVQSFIQRAYSIGTDTKTRHLLTALKAGWNKLAEIGAQEKAVVFTESRRSMEFLRGFLEANGYAGQVVCFSGGGRKDPASTEIYRVYKAAHPNDKSSRDVMMRHALIDAFRNKAKILIATEAGAEGINLQFCSMVVNYDLPWNPQRVEQRIGRCHRYGQKYDVVVVNFCNTRNAADVRVYQLLSQKFKLFEGLFGVSNDVLGMVDVDGKSFERKIHDILQFCRSEEDINAAFDKLQIELQDQIAAQRAQASQEVLENLDDEVRVHLKVDPVDAQNTLDESEMRFMAVTRQMLADIAVFDSEALGSFTIKTAPAPGIPVGKYVLKAGNSDTDAISYRPNTALGEWVIESAKRLQTPYAHLMFNISQYKGKISILEQLKGHSGFLYLERLILKGLDRLEFLLFSVTNETGTVFYDPEIGYSLFKLSQTLEDKDVSPVRKEVDQRLMANATQYANATATRVGEENNEHFKQETDKLIRWGEDQVAAATHKIEVLRGRRLEVERAIRHARTLDEQIPLQKELDQICRDVRRARVNVSSIEDETDEKRRKLLDALQRKLIPEVSREELFTIKWTVC